MYRGFVTAKFESSTVCPRLAVLLISFVVFAGCVVNGAFLKANEETDCTTYNSEEIVRASTGASPKMIVATFLFGDARVQNNDSQVAFGKGRTPASQGCNFSFVLIGDQDEVLAKYGIWDPRLMIVDDPPETGFLTAKETFISARFPFAASAKEIRILDAKKNIVSNADLTVAIRNFCLKNATDMDCRMMAK